MARRAAATADKWEAAFAPSGEPARFHATQNLVHWIWPDNTLIVVDYAATSLGVLKDWFAVLAPERDRTQGGKLRILLLERQADPDSGWWAELIRRHSADRAGPADLIGRDALVALPPLLDPPVAAPAAIETAMAGKFPRARGVTDDGEALKHPAACVTLCRTAARSPRWRR